MLAAKKKQLEIHNKLLFPTINTNKENSSGTGAQGQPKVKISDAQHNLIGFEVGITNLPQGDSNGSLRVPESSHHHHHHHHHVNGLRKQPTTKTTNGPRKDGSPGLSMSPH